jgi:non-ribosomal peptide synthase protein (TIGR01720 family)
VSGDSPARVRSRVAALSDAQRRVLAERLTNAGVGHASERLIAFVVPDGAAPSDDALRAFLADRVPEYMIPSRFVALERLPRTAAGKLDRRALAHVEGAELSVEAARTPTAPGTEVERKLAAIWMDVLKLDTVGVDDDFFEMGGDSLLSIRVIARAGREGIRIAPERFFERPTIAHMAASVDGASVRGTIHDGPRTPRVDPVGDAPLTPIQHWFLDAVPQHRDWWNQSHLLELGHALDAAQLQAIVRELVTHHDALRLRLTGREGHWRQEFVAPDGEPPFRIVDLRSLAPTAYAARIAEECEREHASLRLEDGRLFRCVVFDGDAGWRRILLLGHHLVLDGVSWNIILDDLATLVSQAADGLPLRLPEKTDSARAWAIALAEHAATPSVLASAAHWLALPTDAASVAPGRNGDAVVLTLTLGGEQSRAVLQEAPRRLNASAQVVLLAALLIAWREWSGSDALRLDLEGHGRDALGDRLDVSRTVGWFTTVFPLHLTFPTGMDNGSDPPVGSIVSAVQTAVDALPLRGAAHGLARFLAPDDATREALASQPRPTVLFNHLGTHDLTLPSTARLTVTDEPSGRSRHPDAPCAYVIEINTRVERDALIVTIEHSRHRDDGPSLEPFATAYRAALESIAHGSSATFGLAGLDATSLAVVADLLAEADET